MVDIQSPHMGHNNPHHHADDIAIKREARSQERKRRQLRSKSSPMMTLQRSGSGSATKTKAVVLEISIVPARLDVLSRGGTGAVSRTVCEARIPPGTLQAPRENISAIPLKTEMQHQVDNALVIRGGVHEGLICRSVPYSLQADWELLPSPY